VSAAAVAGTGSLVLTGGMLVTMDPGRRVLTGDLVITDGVITHVGGPSPSGAGGPGARVIDLGGKVVMPGLVQAHIHLCQTLFRGLADEMPLLDWLRQRIWPLEAALDEAALRASARLGIAELLRGGTTTLLDMGTVRHHHAVFEELAVSGMRGFSGKAMMDQGEAVPAGLLESTRASLDESAELARAFRGSAGGRLGYAYAPRFVLSCSRPLLEEVVARSHADGDLIHSHASENPDECRVVRDICGADNVSYFDALGLRGPGTVLAHCVHLGDHEVAQLAAAKTGVTHCPSSNLKLASGIADVPRLLAAGVPVAIGADGAPCNNNLDAFMEARLCGLLARVRHGATAIPSWKVLDLATRGGAEVLGLQDRIGSLEVGKRGDVITVDLGGPHVGPGGDLYGRLVYAARSSDVREVAVDGRLLVEGGQLLSLDATEVSRRAAEVLPGVLSRAGLA
jgi:cytosine/adenosine deaminase-related metal-dependent hydrolase